MANRSKDRGTAWETALVRYLREHGFPDADRHPARGGLDVGDISGVPGFVIEAKNVQRLDLRKWCDEAKVEQERAEVPFSFVALKRSGTTDPGDGFGIMRIRDMVALAAIVAELQP